MKNILTYISLALLAVTAILTVFNQRLKRENERLSANQTALLSQVEYWTTENEKNVADVFKLTLTVGELEKSNLVLKKTADELGISLKRIQSGASSCVDTKVDIKTVVRDSIIYRDSVIAPIKAFDWHDAWTDIHGEIERDSVDLSVHCVDTLTTIVHKVPHKIWFIKWGCKAIKQTVVSSNPHTKITYTEYIEVK